MQISKISKLQRLHHFILWLALKHHKTHKKKHLNFKTHSYQKTIFLDDSTYIVIIKSTQCGITEYLLVRALGSAIKGRSVFYVLPTYQLVNRFVRNRADKSINITPYYKSLERIAKRQDDYKRSESMTLKDIGKGSIAFVGSNSSASFTEFPADDVIIDELDECDQENIEMAWERLSASEDRREIKVANPTFEGYGIDKEFATTDKMEWNIKCECNKYVKLDWFQNVVREVDGGSYVIRDREWDWNTRRDIMPICQHCDRPIDRKSEGIWAPTAQSYKRGYHISKLFSGTVTYVELLERFMKGLKNDNKLQRFYNADLGQAYTAKGARIDMLMLKAILGNYRNGLKKESGFGIMGIDVGKVLNIIIGYLNPDASVQIAYIAECPVEVKEVVKLYKEYNVRLAVIDAQPEKHFVTKLKAKIQNLFSCYYADAKKEPVDQYKNITIDRTASLDSVKEAIVLKNIILPANSESIKSFYEQMTASIRIFDQKRNKGKGGYVWEEGGKPDHYHHAMNYMYIARKLVIMLKTGK